MSKGQTGYGAGTMERKHPVLPDLMEGDGLVLKRWQIADAALLAVAVTESIEHLRPWMPWIAQEPMALEPREAMLAQREREWEGGGDVMLAVMTGDRVAGSCGLHRRIGAGGLELGYWIHPAFTRRGLATATARLLTDAAFSVPSIQSVEIHHDKANQTSARIPSKLEFSLIEEVPSEPVAPAELGIECIWRIAKADWANACSSDEHQRAVFDCLAGARDRSVTPAANAAGKATAAPGETSRGSATPGCAHIEWRSRNEAPKAVLSVSRSQPST